MTEFKVSTFMFKIIRNPTLEVNSLSLSLYLRIYRELFQLNSMLCFGSTTFTVSGLTWLLILNILVDQTPKRQVYK